MEESEIIRDAAIQRFEFTFELAWKALRAFLNEAHGIICNSPKRCIREGLTLELYNAKTAEKLLRMVDDKNETTHTYDESRANEIYNNIRRNYLELLGLLKKCIS